PPWHEHKIFGSVLTADELVSWAAATRRRLCGHSQWQRDDEQSTEERQHSHQSHLRSFVAPSNGHGSRLNRIWTSVVVNGAKKLTVPGTCGRGSPGWESRSLVPSSGG